MQNLRCAVHEAKPKRIGPYSNYVELENVMSKLSITSAHADDLNSRDAEIERERQEYLEETHVQSYQFGVDRLKDDYFSQSA